jgi:AcrR family transcriptional regulator
MLPSPEVAVERARDALARGELSAAELTARGVGELLGKTTGALYHHWGSLDGFLHQVAQSGFVLLGAELGKAFSERGDLADVAERFVDFGLAHPDLYELMFVRKYDWDALRRAGALGSEIPGTALWTVTIAELRARGSRHADRDARLLYAGLHGLVSLAVSGRANVGRIEVPDAAMAKALARDLARRLFLNTSRRKKR